MTFFERRISNVSASGRLLLVLAVAVLPLLVFVLASALWQGAPAAGAAPALLATSTAVPTGAQPLAQGVLVSLADPSRRGVSTGPLALNMASVLALAALGVLAAWWLGRRWQVLSAPEHSHRAGAGRSQGPGFRTATALAGRAVAPGFEAPAMAQWHSLADALPQLVSIMQADRTTNYVNQRWADYTGLPRAALVQGGLGVLVHPGDEAGVSAAWAAAASRGVSVACEYRLRCADGTFRWMLERAVPLPATGEKGEKGEKGDSGVGATQWLMTCTDIDELKQAAVLLEKAVTLKRLVARMAKVGGWTIALPERTLTWSPENCLIHDVPAGYQPTLEEGIGYFLPEHRSVVTGFVEACIAHGTPYDFVLPKHTARQRLIWVRSIGEAVRNEAGQIIGLQGAFQDVTEQKSAELRTQALEVQLTTTMDGISDGFYLLDKNWTFTYLNASAERMFKRQHSDLLGRCVWDVFPEVVGTVVETEHRLTTTALKTRHFEAFFAPLATWFDVHLYPMGDGVAVYLQDVTQTRADQAQLRLLQTAVARLNDTVVIAEISTAPGAASATLPVVFVNEAFARCTGYPQADLMGQDFAGLLQARLSSEEWARVSHALAQRQPVRTEMALTSKAGAALWLEVDVTPIADASGAVTHWVAVKRDMTERRQHQHEVLQLNDTLDARVKRRTAQLEAANKELESFAYAVSHDLRSPLNTIAGFVPMLVRSESDQLSDKGRHYLSRIAAGVTQMGALISGLLTLAHLSREQPRLEALDLTAMAQKIALHYSQRYSGRRVMVTVAAGLQARGDPRLMEAVLEQLMDNAWKFSSARADAVIDIGRQPGHDTSAGTVFFVRDNGAGFDMAFAHKLFGTFERLHPPGEFVGTGIGLATAKRVIDNHGGRIWAESAVGQGATFYFTLG